MNPVKPLVGRPTPITTPPASTRMARALSRAARARRELATVHDAVERGGNLADGEIRKRIDAYNHANAELALTVFDVLGIEPTDDELTAVKLEATLERVASARAVQR